VQQRKMSLLHPPAKVVPHAQAVAPPRMQLLLLLNSIPCN
jgi:hypothetical protein